MGLFGFVGDLIKTKVKVPAFKPVEAGAIEDKAISDAISKLGQASTFTRALNEENQSAMDLQFEGKIPGLAGIDSKIAQNIQDKLAGKIPDDVADQIFRKSAARGVEGGFAGSEFGRNLTSRDLGLTSLQIAQSGFGDALNWISNVRSNRLAPNASPSAMFISPEQRLNLSVSERDKTLNRDYLSNQLKAAQSWQTSLGNQFNSFDQMLTSVASSYGGGMASSAGGAAGKGLAGSFGGGTGGYNPGATGNAGFGGIEMPSGYSRSADGSFSSLIYPGGRF